MTDWQKLYESNTTPWDRGGPCPALVQWLERHQVSGRVLVPGCGHGNDLKPLAEGGAEHVLGLDIAPGAIDAATERQAGVPRVELRLGDLFADAHGELAGSFDWVFEHTCFCAIDPSMRDGYAAAVSAALKPGGHLLAVYYLRPWEDGEDQTQGPPFGCTVEELNERFGKHFTLLDSYIPDVAYPGREGRELLRLLRKL